MAHEITDPFRTDTLDVGAGHTLHWSEAGNPDGKPAILLHGGPGSGSSPRHRRLFDPARYRIIQFDQRNCGASTPYAGEPTVDLSTNTTPHLVDDIEKLRRHLSVDRWLVWGGSWGTTLGLVYAEAHPDAVTELVLGSVVSTNSSAVEWVTRTVGRVFPEEWRVFRDHLPEDLRSGNLAEAYHRLLMSPDPEVHGPAARAWCAWEDAHVSLATDGAPGLRDEDPSFRLCFARIVTHYWANAAFLDDDHILRNAGLIRGIPTYLAHGRLDISSPLDFPLQLAEAVGATEFLIADADGHGGTAMTEWTVSVTDSLAR